MADRYGFWRLLREGLRGHTGWGPAWRDPAPKAEYDVIIIGGGRTRPGDRVLPRQSPRHYQCCRAGKGLSRRRAMLGRNTTIVRSNYLHTGNQLFYEKSLQLWEGLSADLDYNVMFSPRSIINCFPHRRPA